IRVRIVHYRYQILDVNLSDSVVEGLAAKRKPGVLGCDLLSRVRLEIVFEIEINDFAARRHNISDHSFAKVENVEHQLAAERRNIFRFLALFENQSQLFFTVRKLGARNWFHSK